MRYLLLPFTPRYILLTIALLGTLALAGVAALDPKTLPVLSLPLAILGGLLLLGICDLIRPSRDPAQLSDRGSYPLHPRAYQA